MRVALVLLLVVGCAAKEKAAKQETTAGGAAAPESGGGPANVGSAPAESAQQVKAAEPDLKKESDRQGAEPKTGAPPPGGPDPVVRGGKGSAVEAARSGGMLGPSDQRAFQNAGKVSIKKFSSKDLDAAVKTKLEDVQACYDKALEFADKLAGELTITVKDGKPTVSKSTVKNAELEKCVVDALVAATLPKSKATLVLAFKHE